MPRRVQDIVPNTHRSIRDIPLEKPSSMVAPIQPPKKGFGRSLTVQDADTVDETTKSRPDMRRRVPDIDPEAGQSVPPRVPQLPKKRSGGKKLVLIILGIIVVVAIAGYLASVYFSKASFTIVPKVVPFTVDSTYISQSTPDKGVLVYDIASMKGSESMDVPAIDGPKVSTTAKGKITLYNTYSTQSQRLIAGTRLSDDTDRVYRLTSSIVLPGGTSAKPGTVTVTVTADQPGQSYNISKSDSVSDFKIVAYKGSPKYDSMYGRIASDITGGFVGTKKTIDPAVLSSTTAQLQNKITSTLLEKLKSSVPPGYIMYPNGYVASISSPTVGGTDEKSAIVTVNGTVYGILFKRSDLVARIAGDQAVDAFDGFQYETPGLESIDFSIANAKDFSPEKKNTLIIKLKGEAMLVGSVPVDELKSKLSGLSLVDTSDVLRSYRSIIEIEKSSGSITPPWSKVPSDPNRITIEVLTK